jgi:mono/diheme cytochrome c family protein
MRSAVVAASAVLVLAVIAYAVTAPSALSADELPSHTPDAAAGERVFWAGGCASCHASPVDGKRARGDDKLLLGGGMELASAKGTFVVPNISPSEEHGIGRWSTLDFVNAMLRGVSPDGRHYYPSFPYASYARMRFEDVIDLKAYLDTLPEVSGGSTDHELRFPWSLRRGIGAWKRLYLDAGAVVDVKSPDALFDRGRYLVEGPGHCGECHTPRNRFAALDTRHWLAGAPHPDGEGRVPNITPAGENVADWSAADIVYYLESGFTPDFDAVGGSMVAVQENMAKLSADDREAIAAYLKAVPAIE